jgi:16S rRNA (guanine(966)-N(2))-methyltransferase RsmD
MRVIAGSARRLLLESPSEGVRPTTDRTKETLFNMIQSRVYHAKVLDVFSGSGALGIEALSRGADQCVFNDINNRSIEIIKNNLNHTKLIEKAKIIKYDYVNALDSLSKSKDRFDIIFLDPPYNHGYESIALQKIDTLKLLSENGLIVVESSIDTQFNDKAWSHLMISREKAYRTNKFTFIEYKKGEIE